MLIAEVQHIKLSELATRIKECIDSVFGDHTHWVIAEISGHKFYANQDRHYFELVEKAEGKQEDVVKLNAKSWKTGSQTIKKFEEETGQKFSSGIQVLVRVTVEYHIRYGLSLTLVDIDPNFTLGNIEKQRRETLDRLVLENPDAIKLIDDQYITKNKQLKISLTIQRIALIASPNSEGYKDFVHTLENNPYHYKFYIDKYFSGVQGVEAAKELVATLIQIYDSKKVYDCVVIIRGGGARTDFLIFDSYSLARAIARFPIPVITGIGHLKDVSITDLMAHTQTKTPTKAAELIITHNRMFEDIVTELQKTIIIKSQQLLSRRLQSINFLNSIIVNKTRSILNFYKETLNSFNQTVINKSKTILLQRQKALMELIGNLTTKPIITVGNKLNDLENQKNNISSFLKKYLFNLHGYLSHYEHMIDLMKPKKIMQRGFAIVKQKGNILSNADNIVVGSEIEIVFSEVEINSRVITKSPKNGTGPDI